MEIFFAGGCFWCIEASFAKHFEGIQCTPGYMGGEDPNPSYEQVCMGHTGHYEVVRIQGEVPFEKLIDAFWRMIDPFDPAGQFNDRGLQYRTAIFYTTEPQKAYARKTKDALQAKTKKTIYTEITDAQPFYAAELYHQRFFKKNPEHYAQYENASCRVERLKSIWDDLEK